MKNVSDDNVGHCSVIILNGLRSDWWWSSQCLKDKSKTLTSIISSYQLQPRLREDDFPRWFYDLNCREEVCSRHSFVLNYPRLAAVSSSSTFTTQLLWSNLLRALLLAPGSNKKGFNKIFHKYYIVTETRANSEPCSGGWRPGGRVRGWRHEPEQPQLLARHFRTLFIDWSVNTEIWQLW